MLEGKSVNLRIVEKEDLPLIIEWCSRNALGGEFGGLLERSRTELEKAWSEPGQYEFKDFLIEKKDRMEDVTEWLT